MTQVFIKLRNVLITSTKQIPQHRSFIKLFALHTNHYIIQTENHNRNFTTMISQCLTDYPVERSKFLKTG